MKAIVYKQYGGSEQLQLEIIEKPSPNEDQILVRVRAISINDWDWALLTGDPWITKFMQPKGKKILGSDIAGVVEAVGSKVTKFKTGDEVYGDISEHWGGMAEFVCAPEHTLRIKPPGMSFVDAAALPQAGMLAVQGLIDLGKIHSGQKVLINGAGGGCGTIGVQLVKQYDVEVTGVDHTRKLDVMKRSGFDHVIDYTKEDFTKGKEQYDVIFDVKTNRSPLKFLRVLRPGGVYVTCGGHLDRLLQTFILGPFVRWFSGKKVMIVALKPNKDLEYLAGLMAQGKMKPLIDSVYKLEDSRKAYDKYSKQEHIGKIVITVD